MILEMKHRAWCMLSQHRSTALHPCSLASPPLTGVVIHTYSLRNLDAEAGELLSIGGQPRPQCETPRPPTKEVAEERKERCSCHLERPTVSFEETAHMPGSFSLTLKSVLVWVARLFVVPAQIDCFCLVWLGTTGGSHDVLF